MQTRNRAMYCPADLTGRIGWARCEVGCCVIVLVSKAAVVAKMVNLEASNPFGFSKSANSGFSMDCYTVFTWRRLCMEYLLCSKRHVTSHDFGLLKIQKKQENRSKSSNKLFGGTTGCPGCLFFPESRRTAGAVVNKKRLF